MKIRSIEIEKSYYEDTYKGHVVVRDDEKEITKTHKLTEQQVAELLRLVAEWTNPVVQRDFNDLDVQIELPLLLEGGDQIDIDVTDVS